ncbi:MAG: hypothetical protein Q9227_004872 [Pyrenula ochraceoflavens]
MNNTSKDDRAINEFEDDDQSTIPTVMKMSHVEIVSPSHSLPSSPKLKWTYEQRTTICLMYRFFKNPASQFAEIFNSMYQPDTEVDGFPDGIPSTSIAAMWHNMRKRQSRPAGNRLWILVEQSSRDQLKQEYSELISMIEDAADKCNVHLNDRNDSPRLRPVGRPKSRRMETFTDTSEEEEEDDDDAWTTRSDSSEPPLRCHGKVIPSMKTNGWKGTIRLPLPTEGAYIEEYTVTVDNHKCLWSALSGIPVLQLCSTPKGRARRILWRAFNPSVKDDSGAFTTHVFNSPSGFRAGLFKDSSQSVIAPFTDLDKFREIARSHLSDDGRQEPTPFISFYESPIPAFCRALKLHNGMISVIDLQRAVELLQNRFPHAAGFLWIAKSLVNNFKFADLRNKYTGRGEYLIWGEVTAEAMVTTFSMEDIRKERLFENTLQLEIVGSSPYTNTARDSLNRLNLPKANFDTGEILGKLIKLYRPLQWRHSELIAAKLSTAWNFPLAKRRNGWDKAAHENYKSFMNGVFSGLYDIGEQVLTYPQSLHDVEVYGTAIEDCITVQRPNALNIPPLEAHYASHNDNSETELPSPRNIPSTSSTLNRHLDSTTGFLEADSPPSQVNDAWNLSFQDLRSAEAASQPPGVFQIRHKRHFESSLDWEQKDRETSPLCRIPQPTSPRQTLPKRTKLTVPMLASTIDASLMSGIQEAAEKNTPTTSRSTLHSSPARANEPASWILVDGEEVEVVDLTHSPDSSNSPRSLSTPTLDEQNEDLGEFNSREKNNDTTMLWKRHDFSNEQHDVFVLAPTTAAQATLQEEPICTQTTSTTANDVSRYFRGGWSHQGMASGEAYSQENAGRDDEVMQSIEFDEDTRLHVEIQCDVAEGDVGWKSNTRGDGFAMPVYQYCSKNGE